jgi:hypothetical protein
LRRYLTVLTIGSLAWEFLHMPLYTLWSTGTWGAIALSVLHCTGGDLLIGLATLTIALLVTGSPAWPKERFRQVAVLTVSGGLLYTAFSEWLNVEVRTAWAYSDLMPTLQVAGFWLGLSPMLQWLVVPTLAFRAASSA